ncbi:polycomb group protein EMBRYONIC FLOWER 2-like [Pyrus ussuriensis x Pyrus communis]|uniref:Polycomb group protein EMBRYONIC FLOWER 2-like n=1 Tax=Pyrus ussuriensis x Pyrus communis TaxID=2448454 RepID=A0A5N5H9G4_9ROSA|nr:polycomb group protein EMBRYONIC FLOWER 2-like [Pyrus ussuriensis x Pyrus communis]
MCRQNSCAHVPVEEAVAIDESLLIYCKPVELYNILRPRALHNPLFLRRCLRYKIQARRRKRSRAGVVIFNYRDYNNTFRKTEVTEDFSCPFCLMQCASFKGLRYHLCSSHDLFNFEFWVTGEYQAVNVSVKVELLRSETVADGVVPQLQTFFFWSVEISCSRSRKHRPKNHGQLENHVNIQFLELDSPSLANGGAHEAHLENGDGVKAPNLLPGGKDFQNGRCRHENCGHDHPNSVECIECATSSSNGHGATISIAQSSPDIDCVKLISGTDYAPPTKIRKLAAERSEPRNRMLLQKRQFFHSHRVQPMELEQVLSERDSEDEVDDDIADLDDRRMLDDFVDVTKDEKHLMHLWNSFVRKQSVLADGHVAWACEAFSRLHAPELNSSPDLFWCWRLFMIKLWNHGLLDACVMNGCNIILDDYKHKGSESSDAMTS